MMALRTITIPISLTTTVEEDQMMALRTITIPSSLTTEIDTVKDMQVCHYPKIIDTLNAGTNAHIDMGPMLPPLIMATNDTAATYYGDLSYANDYGNPSYANGGDHFFIDTRIFLGRNELEIFKIKFLEETNWRF